jgi:hypothetical protein
LSTQVDFLESAREFGLCATNAISIDEEGRETSGPWWPQEGKAIDWEMIWSNPIAQSSVMVRRRLLQDNYLVYDQEYPPAEDYHLWCRLFRKTRFFRLAQPFLRYRALETGAFKSQTVKAMNKSIQANGEMVADLVGGVVPEFHPYLTDFASILPKKEWKEPAGEIRRWFGRVRHALRDAGMLDLEEFRSAKGDARRRLHGITQRATTCSYSCFNLEFKIREKLGGLKTRFLRAWN